MLYIFSDKFQISYFSEMRKSVLLHFMKHCSISTDVFKLMFFFLRTFYITLPWNLMNTFRKFNQFDYQLHKQSNKVVTVVTILWTLFSE